MHSAETSVKCEHKYLTSTFETGPICVECKEPLVSFFWPISRNTPTGKLLWNMLHKPTEKQKQ